MEAGEFLPEVCGGGEELSLFYGAKETVMISGKGTASAVPPGDRISRLGKDREGHDFSRATGDRILAASAAEVRFSGLVKSAAWEETVLWKTARSG